MPPKLSKAQRLEQRTVPRLAPLTTAHFQLQVNNLKERANGTPKDPVRYSLPSSDSNNDEYALSLQDEVKLAEAVAFIVAVKKGVEHVSASAIAVPEAAHDGLLFVIASNDGISVRTRRHLSSVIQAIERIAAGGMSKATGRDLLLTLIVEMNSSRINERLNAKKKDKPIILRGLEQILYSIDQSKLDAEHAAILKDRVRALQRQIKNHGIAAKSIKTVERLKNIALACHEFWGAPGSQSTRDMLAQTGANVHELRGNPCLLYIGKIAAYSYISKEIVAYTSRGEYQRLFQHITLQYVSAYDPIPSAIPGAIKGGCKQCRVHAEVQLVIELDTSLSAKWKRPRTIGSSKAACFLCDLFMHKHGLYFVPRSHGVLTPLWVIPDAEIMTKAQKKGYRGMINAMLVEISRLTNLKHPPRIDPAMSWHNFSQLGLFRDSPDISRILTPMSASQPVLLSSVLEGVLEDQSAVLPQADTMMSGSRPAVSAVDIEQIPEGHAALSTPIECDESQAAEAENIDTPDACAVAEFWTPNSLTCFQNGSMPVSPCQSFVKADVDKACQSLRSPSTVTTTPKSTFNSFAPGESERTAAKEWPNDARAQAEPQTGKEAIDTALAQDEAPTKVSTSSDASDTMVIHNQTLNPTILSPSETAKEIKSETFTDLSYGQMVEQSTDIRGHGSRYSGSAYQDGPPRQHHRLMVAHSDKLSQSINFHDLEILLEAEDPATMLVDIVYIPEGELLISTTEGVNVRNLKPGEELIICAGTGAGGSGNLRVVMQDDFGKAQQWEMKWKHVI